MHFDISIIRVTTLDDGSISVLYNDGTGSSFSSWLEMQNEIARQLIAFKNTLPLFCLNQYIVNGLVPVTATLNTDDVNGAIVTVTL